MADYYEALDTTNWTPGTRYFTQITDENHAGWLYIVTLLSFVYVIVAFVIRFFVKYGTYGYDDWALLASTVLAICQYSIVIAGLSKGIGRTASFLGLGRVNEIRKYAAAHAYLHVGAHCCSKISTAVLTQRLFENGRRRNSVLSWFLIAASAFYGIGSLLILAVRCGNPYDAVSDNCPHVYPRWEAIFALDITTEGFLIAIPFILVSNIQIKLSAKLTVIAVFSVRAIDILFAAFNLHLVHDLGYAADPVIGVVELLCWTQAELLWSIIAASLPCLKTFMRPFDKVDAETWRSGTDIYSSGRSGRAGWRGSDDVVPLESIKASSSVNPSSRSLELRPENISHNVVISHPEDDIRFSWGSEERIIKTQVEFQVRRESRGRDPYEIP